MIFKTDLIIDAIDSFHAYILLLSYKKKYTTLKTTLSTYFLNNVKIRGGKGGGLVYFPYVYVQAL